MPDWQRLFIDPIPLPGGRKLLTLKEAADFIIALPKRQHDAPEWRAAMEALLLSAEHGQPAPIR